MKTYDQQLEAETIIRWDETGELAVLWTASSATRKAWKSYGFPVVEDQYGCWSCRVPIDRVTYKPMKRGPGINPLPPTSANLENLRGIS